MLSLQNVIPNRNKAIFFAKKQLAEFVTESVNLEGINFTLPEVQTLLDGVTVGGHKISDTTITLNQIAAWKYLFKALESNQFEISTQFVCKLHELASKEEALEWGQFRTGPVTIAGTQYTPPPAATLREEWHALETKLATTSSIFDKAACIFLQMARIQFFYDVNKRMGRLMMNGILLNAGYPAINVPAAKQLTFNQYMLAFYTSNDMTEMKHFLLECLDQRILDAMSLSAKS